MRTRGPPAGAGGRWSVRDVPGAVAEDGRTFLREGRMDQLPLTPRREDAAETGSMISGKKRSSLREARPASRTRRPRRGL
jgi:hypothetical protein